MTKIAVVGSAPSSRLLAPYSDPSWKIWACSPANQGKLPRIDAWFELHALHYIKSEWATEKPLFDWLNAESFDVWLQEETDILPRAWRYPVEEILAKFPRFVFSSSVAWMVALALHTFDNADLTLGFWGVDMAAKDEYASQRAGLQHLCDYAERHGVKLIGSMSSDLLAPAVLYGYSAGKHMASKIRAREQELKTRIEACRQQEMSAHDERLFLQGALDDLEYFQRVWTG